MKSALVTMGYVTATALGKEFTPTLTPQEINQRLKDIGLHICDAAGVWRLTDKGEPVGVFVKMAGDRGFIKWSPSVAAMLGAKASEPVATAKKKIKLGAFAKKRKTAQ